MGFHVEINSILRSDDRFDLTVGGICEFQKKGSRVFFDDIPIWLTKSDWTALAEIRIVSQTRSHDGITGKFSVLHAYKGEEQKQLTKIFRRMYSFPGEFDPYFYLLEPAEVLESAQKLGFLVRDDLKTEGFIHASPANQLTRVANKYYRNVKDLRCAIVAKKRVLAQVKYEAATGGVYPHIFGPLNTDAIDAVVSILPKDDGTFDIDVATLMQQKSK